MRLTNYIVDEAKQKGELNKIAKAIATANTQTKMTKAIKMVQGYDKEFAKTEKEGIGFDLDFVYSGSQISGADINNLLKKVQKMAKKF